MQAGGAVAAGFWEENSDAILTSFYGGEQFSPAVFDVMYGRTNPSGKLPVTFP